MMKEKTISGLRYEDFASQSGDASSTRLFVLRNKAGMEVCLTNYGGIVLSIMVPDRNGVMGNVVIGGNTVDKAQMLAKEWYIGALIGPVAGRVIGGRFRIGGEDYSIPLNSGPNTLHSGEAGFHTVVWEATQESEKRVSMKYEYKDGEAGFPGNIHVTATFTLTDDNALKIDYEAFSDKPTLFCPTHHGYFNLNGTDNPVAGIENHLVEIDADFYLPTDENTNHTGEILKVENTPFDFRKMRAIGDRINDDHVQLHYGKGYDHVFVLRKRALKELTHAARVKSPSTGRVMDVLTTEIGMVMYTGNYLNGVEGLNGAVFSRRDAVCFETQSFPDTPNNLHFPPVELMPGNRYFQTCIYKFSVEQ